eukprot:CAMPEP_0174320764 /NCGR_PEP_ID=MMETSP0810-20121108/9789_1 /TAXON_ID=73025 ORGANISM="Eutreptiella gymnastica-like, Strain CCMP1594" /NCGR_SAMPLE_ID=MMETSP0810 /ASSEMBLY_ACC=CAM_ASM_000659 /LENGTH=73 /DNA_ID=CAMNT_0015431829 /DNA_START=244 /DNA_END=460 /DNA_ORIENTATION=+
MLLKRGPTRPDWATLDIALPPQAQEIWECEIKWMGSAAATTQAVARPTQCWTSVHTTARGVAAAWGLTSSMSL